MTESRYTETDIRSLDEKLMDFAATLEPGERRALVDVFRRAREAGGDVHGHAQDPYTWDEDESAMLIEARSGSIGS